MNKKASARVRDLIWNTAEAKALQEVQDAASAEANQSGRTRSGRARRTRVR